ncbi:MAG: SpoIVB peptidase S55 domain-containing protein [Blautia sp.]
MPDYLLAINETSVQNIQQVASLLKNNCSKTVTLKIRRNNKDLQIKLNPIATKDGSYSLGIWLREDTEGIGTMTCVLENNTFAALGHGITDVDTGLLIELNNGGLYQATVNKIVSGKRGTPGELSGIVHLNNNNKIGSVLTNNHWGISGRYPTMHTNIRKKKGISLALKQEIKTGKAFIRRQLGKEIRYYEIIIDEVQMNAKDNKDLVLRVTDPELLRKTGGIVQGMSGSPILQNGKLIGAVTHVFVSTPAKGMVFLLKICSRNRLTDLCLLWIASLSSHVRCPSRHP